MRIGAVSGEQPVGCDAEAGDECCTDNGICEHARAEKGTGTGDIPINYRSLDSGQGEQHRPEHEHRRPEAHLKDGAPGRR